MKKKKAMVGWDFIVKAIIGLILLFVLGWIIYAAVGEGSSVIDKIKEIF